jgi:hypothetical protein
VTAAVQRVVAAGDHMTISGLIFDAQVNDAPPLLYHARRFESIDGVQRTPRKGEQ